MALRYEFEWDPIKAAINRSKHGVDFAEAAEVFRDPLALTISDFEHSAREARWITLGVDSARRYVLVIHTFEEQEEFVKVRLISARRPTGAETRAYEEGR
jgi:uncharacterized DUF497 family protein